MTEKTVLNNNFAWSTCSFQDSGASFPKPSNSTLYFSANSPLVFQNNSELRLWAAP